MKNLYLLLFILFTSIYTQAQNQPFITTWEVSPSDLSITIPTHSGSTYNYTVDFGDGTVLNNQTGDATHTYSSAGTYTVSITGTFPRIYFNDTGDKGNINSIKQWGDVQWTSMESAFKGCQNLAVNAIDSPDLSQVTNLSHMFYSVSSFNQSLNNWNVSTITDMSNLFEFSSFNQALNNWNVSNVTNMSGMFRVNMVFNQNINNWDVSNVTNMSNMFESAVNYNQPLGSWNVSNVTDMSYMFSNTNFNQAIANWNVSNVTNMSWMFGGGRTFNQNINNWDVSSVTNMSGMFQSCKDFKQPLNNWDVSNVIDMSNMFEISAFNQPINNWNISNVTNTSKMFHHNDFFNQPLNNWDVSSINNMAEMFSKAVAFNQPLDSWNISNGVNMDAMFRDATNFNQDLTGWNINTANLNNMLANSALDPSNYEALLAYFDSLSIFSVYFNAEGLLYCDDTSRNSLINKSWTIIKDNHLVNCNNNYTSTDFITRWEIEPNYLTLYIPISGKGYNYTINFGDGTILNNVTTAATHTYSNAGVYEISISGLYPELNMCPLSIEQWGNIQWQTMNHAFYLCDVDINATDAPNLSQVTDMSYMFASHDGSINVSLDDWDVSNVINMESLFSATNYNRSLENWDVSNVTNMNKMFQMAYNFNQPIDNWDVSNVTNMSSMFENAMIFNRSLNNWDVSSVTNMKAMFKESRYFNKELNNWDVSSVTNMKAMFKESRYFNKELNNWDVSSVTNMTELFYKADVFNKPIDNWDVSSVTDMSYMFSNTNSFNQPLGNWNVSNVTNMEKMFRYSKFNQPLGNWNVSNVINLEGMFNTCVMFNQNINSWNVGNVINMKRMFYSAMAYNQSLNNWDVSKVLDMQQMFANTSSFNQDLSNWSFNPNVIIDKTTPNAGFLSYSNLDINNYEKLLSRFAILKLSNKTLNAKNVKYCNTQNRDFLINKLGWTIISDQKSSNCNSITGEVKYDESNYNCIFGGVGVSNFIVNANNGFEDFVTYSDNGIYDLKTIDDSFIVSLANHPSYFSVTPASQQVTFTASNTEVADFCVTANQTIEDLNVVLIPTSEARPGFEADYQLVVENIGTQAVTNAIVTLDFDDAMQSFVNAGVTPTSTTANQLTFDIANLQPLTFQTVDITMQTFQPPTVNGDDILSFTTNVTPSANDFTPNDNTFIYDQTVVNSYDPNDKQVLQGEEIEIDDADEYLNYLILFQNTGTASAINVRILDTLHPKLDYSTLRPVNASHNYRIEVNNENQVEFIFDGINLPDENTNEPASHGFVAYKIKPKSDVAVGDFITGDANIYFDFNAPIITNMVSTEIIDDLSSSNYGLENNISIYPNPTQNTLHIELKNNQEIEQLNIYNLSGLALINVKENKQQLNLESLSAGVYFLQIQTNLGTVNKRFIKN